jgi:hypothetical protein
MYLPLATSALTTVPMSEAQNNGISAVEVLQCSFSQKKKKEKRKKKRSSSVFYYLTIPHLCLYAKAVI